MSKIAWAPNSLPSSCPLRAGSDVPHGFASLGSGAAHRSCLQPEPHAHLCPVSWAKGAIGAGSEE